MSNKESLPNDWRDALDGHESPLDTDRFWAGLEPRLPKERRRRGFLWWWVGAGGAAALLLALWLGTPDEGADGGGAASSSTGTGMIRSEAADLAGNASAMEGPESGEVRTRGAEVRQEERPAMPGASRTNPGGRSADAASRGARKPSALAKGTPADAMPSKAKPAMSAKAEASSIRQPPAPEAVHTENAHSENTRTEATHTEATRTEALSTASADQAPAPLPEVVEAAEQTPSEATEALAPEKRKKRRKPALTLDLLAGPGIALRSLGEASGVPDGYLAQRKATETPLESWTVGADLRWTAPKGLFVLGGFRWQRIQERFDWQRVERRSTYGLAEGFLMIAGGGMIPWQDSAWITWEESRTVRHYNKVDQLEIPLALGYRFPLGIFQADAALGASLNIRQWAEGRSLGIEGLPADWNGAEALRWRRSAGLGLLAQAHLGWAPDDRHAFFIQPTIQWSPANRMDPVAGYRVRYTQAFLQVGMSLRLR